MTSFEGTLAPLLDLCTDAPTWRDEAVCRGRWEVFLDEARTAEAIEICGGCPVVAECLADALTRSDQWVLGGKTWRQRKDLKRKAQAGNQQIRGRCAICDSVFYAGRPGAKFCGRNCQAVSNRRRWREAKQTARAS